MSTIITRASKGAPLSWTEADDNLTNLNTDKLEASALTPYLTSATAASTYETQTHASSTYETQTHASSTYPTKDNNLSDLASTSTARTNLGLGTAATQASTAFAASGAVTGNGNTMTTARLLGRTTASTGAIEEISVGVGLSLSGGTLSSTGGASVAFSAYQSVQQSLSSSTWTKVNLQTEEFDTNNVFDSTTNYRFTPTTAGYFQINGTVTLTPNNALVIVAIYKNGTIYKRGSSPFGVQGLSSGVSSIVYLNGTTDYVELWVYSGSSSNNISAVQSETWFNGCRMT